jgi:type VI secretion system protein VasG
MDVVSKTTVYMPVLYVEGQIKAALYGLNQPKRDIAMAKKAIKNALKIRCVYKENGARMLDSSIDGELLPPLSLAVLQQLAAKKPIKRARLKVKDDAFIATIS